MLRPGRLSQYEARLKHWNFRKNLSTSDWVEVAKIIDERKTLGKSSVVFISGEPLEDSQIRKGISRPAVREALQNGTLDNQPVHHLPLYIEIRTPHLGPHIEDVEPDPTSCSLGSSNYQSRISSVEGARTTLGDASSPPLSHLNLDLEGLLHTTSEKTQDLETPIVRNISSLLGMYPQDLQESGFCASPIRVRELSSWIERDVRGKLSFQIEDTFTFLSRFKRISAPHFVPTISMSDTYQQIVLNTLPRRYDYNFGNMTQSSSILQIALYELVNGDFQLQSVGPGILGSGIEGEVNLSYSKPVLWMLSYFQQSPSRFIERLEKHLPSSYLEVILRNMFVIALEACAYKVLECLFLSSKTLSKIPGPLLHVYRLYLAVVIGDGPLGLTASICTHFGERAINWAFLSTRLNVDPASKILCMTSLGIKPKWDDLLPGMTHCQDTGSVHEVISQFPLWESEPCFSLTEDVMYNLIRNMSEADALSNVTSVLERAQPAILHWLTYPTQPSPRERIFLQVEKRWDILALAVARKFDSVIDLLLSAGFQATGYCLFEALHVKRIDLLERLLDHGSSPWVILDGESIRMTGYSASSRRIRLSSKERDCQTLTTPYAEAVRMEINAAIRLFDKTPFQVAIRPIIDAEVFTVIVAAAEVGNETILRRFLEPRLMNPPDMLDVEDWFPYLTEAAKRAAENGHMGVLTILHHAGMVPSLALFENAIHSQNKQMIASLFDNEAEHSKFYRRSPFPKLPGATIKEGPLLHDVVLAAMAYEDQDTLSAVLDCVNLRQIRYPGDFLERAVLKEDLSLVQDLIQRGVHPNAPLSMEAMHTIAPGQMKLLETPLVVAIRTRNKPIVALLLKEDAWTNPDYYECRGMNGNDRFIDPPGGRCISALEAAAAIHDADLIHELLCRGAEPYDSRAIITLSESRDWMSVDTLLRKGEHQSSARKSDLLWTALMAAVHSTNLDLLGRLLSHVNQDITFPPDYNMFLPHVNQDTTFPPDYNMLLPHCIPARSRKGGLGKVQHLRLNILSFAMYSYVRKRCTPDNIYFLLNHGGHTESICLELFGYTGMYGLSAYQTEGIICAYTPLQNAVFLGSKACVDILIEFGADINRKATTVSNRTALQLAAETGDVEMVSYLISKGALVNAPPAPREGFTALQIAAMHGFYRIAEMLIKAKAEVDAPRAKVGGRTAFEAATENGRLDMMGLLVKHGALSNNREQQYERAVKFAKAQGQDPAVEHAAHLRAKILEVTKAAEEEYQELMEYPMPGLDT